MTFFFLSLKTASFFLVFALRVDKIKILTFSERKSIKLKKKQQILSRR